MSGPVLAGYFLDMRLGFDTIEDAMRHEERKQGTNALPFMGSRRFVSAKVESAGAVRPGYGASCSHSNSRPSFFFPEVNYGTCA